MEPTLLLAEGRAAPAMREEIFGPILPILTMDGLPQMIRFVRADEKPLALYLFTRSRAAQREVLGSLSFGGGCVNDTIIHLATTEMGFGGVGASGMGAYHGRKSFDTFTHEKSVVHRGRIPGRGRALPPLYRKKGEAGALAAALAHEKTSCCTISLPTSIPMRSIPIRPGWRTRPSALRGGASTCGRTGPFPLRRDYPAEAEVLYLFDYDGAGVYLSREAPLGCALRPVRALRELAQPDAFLGRNGAAPLRLVWDDALLRPLRRKDDPQRDRARHGPARPAATRSIRASPRAVIVLITCGERILLAQGKHYAGNFYSLIAGYLEIGESLEQAACREALEETGLHIRDLTYFGNQPWPFTDTQMVGFFARADDREPIRPAGGGAAGRALVHAGRHARHRAGHLHCQRHDRRLAEGDRPDPAAGGRCAWLETMEMKGHRAHPQRLFLEVRHPPAERAGGVAPRRGRLRPGVPQPGRRPRPCALQPHLAGVGGSPRPCGRAGRPRSGRRAWAATERVGVFATRSPFRPNPIGLSCVRLLGVDLEAEEGPVLRVGGADLPGRQPHL